jgi:hypothetical protein
MLVCRRVKKLVIHRRNLLAAFVSLKEAERSGAWIKWRDAAEAQDDSAKIRLSLREFYIYAAKIKVFHAAVRLIEIVTMQTFRWISYEEMKNGSCQQSLSAFLQTELGRHAGSRTEKQARKPIRDRINNLKQVESFMRLARMKWMLNENV